MSLEKSLPGAGGDSGQNCCQGFKEECLGVQCLGREWGVVGGRVAAGVQEQCYWDLTQLQ